MFIDNIDKSQIIRREVDNSYVVIYNELPYHVPNEGEWVDEWAEVNTYAIEHPEVVEIEPKPTLEELKEWKKTSIANSRRKEENGGCDWLREADGITYRIDTTEKGRTTVNHQIEYVTAMGEAYEPQNWKTESGWILVTLEDLKSMASTIKAHVQKCFDKERELDIAIDNCKSEEELDLIKW